MNFEFSLTQLLSFTLLSLSTWLPILNPFGILPQFTNYTEGLTTDATRAVAKRATLIASAVLAGTTIAGTLVFQFFGISIPAFRIAGGVILFLIALDMLRAAPNRFKTSEEESDEMEERDDIAIFPLAVPFIAGPGSITTALILSDRAANVYEYLVLIVTLLIALSGMFAGLAYSDRLMDRMGSIGKNIMTRIMGLVLAAVAAQFVIDGLKAVLLSIYEAAQAL